MNGILVLLVLLLPEAFAQQQQQAQATCSALLRLTETQSNQPDTTCIINTLCTAVTCETPVQRGNPLNDIISVTFDPCSLQVTYQYFSAVSGSQVINVTTAQNETLMFSTSDNLTLILTPWDMPPRGVNFGAFSTEAEGAETILFPITAISLQCTSSTEPSSTESTAPTVSTTDTPVSTNQNMTESRGERAETGMLAMLVAVLISAG